VTRFRLCKRYDALKDSKQCEEYRNEAEKAIPDAPVDKEEDQFILGIDPRVPGRFKR